jgi:hypothetical protein
MWKVLQAILLYVFSFACFKKVIKITLISVRHPAGVQTLIHAGVQTLIHAGVQTLIPAGVQTLIKTLINICYCSFMFCNILIAIISAAFISG